MSAVSARLKELSPEQRALLLKRLAAREANNLQAATASDEPILSFAQERWLFHDRLTPAHPAHVIFGGLRLRGELELSSLQAALDGVLARHPPLRCAFSAGDGAPRIRPPEVLPLSREDLSTRGGETALADAYRAEMAKGFDLERDLLLRARLIKLADQDHALLFAMHHIASDGWSLGLLLKELAELYRASRWAR